MELWITLIVLLALLGFYVAVSYFYVPSNKIAVVNWKFPLSPKIPSGHVIARTWEQGWWAKHFGPGHHFFEVPFAKWFANVELRDFTKISADKFGLTEAVDGEPLPFGQVVADRRILKPEEDQLDFSDGEYFLTHGGQRGYQIDLLSPGTWAINGQTGPITPGFLWKIEEINPEEISSKEVGILISNFGEQPNLEDPEEVEAVGVNIEGQRVKPGESVFVLKKRFREVAGIEAALRGIIKDPLYPGTRAVNTKAYTLVRVDTQPINLFFDWRTISKFSRDDKNPKEPHPHKFDGLNVVTKDGYTIPIEFGLTVVIPPLRAAHVVALGGEKAVIESLLVPIVYDVIRNVIATQSIKDLVENINNVRERIEFAIRVSVEGFQKAETDMRLAGAPEELVQWAKDFGRKFDPNRIYPLEVSTFRLSEINFEESPDERVREFVNVIAGKTLAEEEIPTLEAQTKREKVRQVREAAAAEADAQVLRVRSEVTSLAAVNWKKAAETLGGEGVLSGNPLAAHPGVMEVATSLSVLLESAGRRLRSSAPPPPPPTAEAPPQEEAVLQRHPRKSVQHEKAGAE